MEIEGHETEAMPTATKYDPTECGRTEGSHITQINVTVQGRGRPPTVPEGASVEKPKSILRNTTGTSTTSAEASRKRTVRFGGSDTFEAAPYFSTPESNSEEGSVDSRGGGDNIGAAAAPRAGKERHDDDDDQLETGSNTSEPTSPRLGAIGWVPLAVQRPPAGEHRKGKQGNKPTEGKRNEMASWEMPSTHQGGKGKGEGSLLDVSVSESTLSPGSEKSLIAAADDENNIEKHRKDVKAVDLVAKSRTSGKPPRGEVLTVTGLSLDKIPIQESRGTDYKENSTDDLPRLFYPTPRPQKDFNNAEEEKPPLRHRDSHTDGDDGDKPGTVSAELLDHLQRKSGVGDLLNPEGGVDPQHLMFDDNLAPPARRKGSVASHTNHDDYDRLIHPSIRLFPDLPPPIAASDSEPSVIVEVMAIEQANADNAEVGISRSGNHQQAGWMSSSVRATFEGPNTISPIGTGYVFNSSGAGVDTCVSNTENGWSAVLNATPLKIGGGSKNVVHRKNSNTGFDLKSDFLMSSVQTESETIRGEHHPNVAKPVDVQTVSCATEMWREVLNNDEEYTMQSSKAGRYLPGDFFEGVQASMGNDATNKGIRKGSASKSASLLPIRGMEIVRPTKPQGENTRKTSVYRKSRSVERRKTEKEQPKVLAVEVVAGAESRSALDESTNPREPQAAARATTSSKERSLCVVQPCGGKVSASELSALASTQLMSKDTSLSEDCASRLRKKWGVTPKKAEKEDDEEERIRRAERFERINLALLKLEVCRKNNHSSHDTRGWASPTSDLDSRYETKPWTQAYSPSGATTDTLDNGYTSSIDPPRSKYWDREMAGGTSKRHNSRPRSLFPPPHSPVKTSADPPVDGLIYTPAKTASARSASWMFERSPDEDRYNSYFMDANSRLQELRVCDSMAAKNFARDLSSLASAVRGSELFSMIS
ncbi:bilobe protein [Trypanosoma brucei equiperdum]|uniref:Bilobe protein n=1 Tax=Trypanosoma brucei equiperdum TaxID=630700 RepID=A0A3L6L8G5_9TRYP|nr:bilobe protein [Trypanosoma brucei equiperdum]